MTDRTDLIARLEAADGPSRELDGHIHAFVQGLKFNWPGKEKDEFGKFIWCFRNPHVANGPDAMFTMASCPLYTASNDAALTLQPKDSCIGVRCYSSGRGMATIRYREFMFHSIKGATPALALCIAALKARGAKDD